jgi:enoyl-CoA hydratase/carnithine racemase
LPCWSSGLVNDVYDDKEKLLEAARLLCRKIAANSPLAVQGAKHILRWAEEHTFDDTLAYVGTHCCWSYFLFYSSYYYCLMLFSL